MEGKRMENGNSYLIWVNWDTQVVSFHAVEGYEPMPFYSKENWQANIHILLLEGFRFQ